MDNWFYVVGQDSVGPVEEPALSELIKSGDLNSDSYVWKKGFDNWQKLKDVSELSHLIEVSANAPSMAAIPTISFDWNTVDKQAKIFHIKIGPDRGEPEAEYGPFSLAELSKAFEEKRINAQTYIYSTGMDNWTILADVPLYQELFSEMPPVIDEIDRRRNIRRPFVAKLFFHDNEKLFEGVCRDISIGGLQILVSDFPCKIGENVSLNVHPDNSDICFTAEGEVVRILEGARGFSLRFTSLNAQAKKSIENYTQNS